MTIRRGVDGLWYVELSASDAAVMGCQWVPMYDGVVVVL